MIGGDCVMAKRKGKIIGKVSRKPRTLVFVDGEGNVRELPMRPRKKKKRK